MKTIQSFEEDSRRQKCSERLHEKSAKNCCTEDKLKKINCCSDTTAVLTLPFSSTTARPSARNFCRLNRSRLYRRAWLIFSGVAAVSKLTRFGDRICTAWCGSWAVIIRTVTWQHMLCSMLWQAMCLPAINYIHNVKLKYIKCTSNFLAGCKETLSQLYLLNHVYISD